MSAGTPPIRAHVTGWGRYVPSQVLTNADLEKMVDTNDEWIVSRTGIRERRVAAAHETTTHAGTSKPSPPAMLPLAISASEITPIVFCASLVPCASATIDDDATCAQRNWRSARSSTKRRMIR